MFEPSPVRADDRPTAAITFQISLECYSRLGVLPESALEPVGGTEAAPVAAFDADRHVDLAHHHGVAVAHVAGVALDQIGALVAPGGKPGRVVEDTAVAAVGGVPGDVARPLRVGIDLVMNRQIAVGVDHGAERHPLVPGAERFLERRQGAIGPVQDFGAILLRFGARYLDLVGVEHVFDREGAAVDAALENLLQRRAGLHRAGDRLGVVVLDRPQFVFDLLDQRDVRPLEPGLRAGLRALADPDPARSDVLQRGLEALALRQLFGLGPADQNAIHRDFVDRRRHHAARAGDLDLEAAGQLLLSAAILMRAFSVSLAQQHRAARLELLRECGDRPSGRGDAFAMDFGFLGRVIDLGGAGADRADEAGG